MLLKTSVFGALYGAQMKTNLQNRVLTPLKYAWVDAFRTSLCSNSQEIAVLLKRFAELDLTAWAHPKLPLRSRKLLCWITYQQPSSRRAPSAWYVSKFSPRAALGFPASVPSVSGRIQSSMRRVWKEQPSAISKATLLHPKTSRGCHAWPKKNSLFSLFQLKVTVA